MADYIVRATAADSNIRAFAIDSKDLVEKARNLHKCTPVVTAGLGRLLSAGAMMASMMKGEDDKLTLQMSGEGPAKSYTVTCDSKGNVKGYAGNPFVDIPLKDVESGKLDVGASIMPGKLNVIMDLGLKDPYNGTIELATGEVGDDLAYYFAKSEQTPSVVALGVMVNRDQSVRCAGGFIIQLMPYASEEVIDALEKKLAEIKSVTALMEEGMGPEDMLKLVLGDMGLEFTEKQDVRFYCNCSKERVSGVLATISGKDLQEMIDDGEEIEVKCHFCSSAYKFSVDELKNILKMREEK